MQILFALLLLCQLPAPVSDLQTAVDSIATGNGGTITLQPGAVYENVRLNIPYTADRRYSNIKIIGNHATLQSPKTGTGSVIHIGGGWTDWDAPKLSGIEIRDVTVVQQSLDDPGANKGILIEFTLGAVIQGVTLRDCPFEALCESGGSSNEQMETVGCTAKLCGKKWPRGPLAAFNLNGYSSRLIACQATDCGWGFESGGTGLRVTGCSFVDSPVALGSTVYGCSNQTLTRNTFERSSITVGNGIGRQSDVQILDNTCIDSPVNWLGASTTNRVQLPKLPWFDHTSLISGNTFVGGDGVRLTAWDAAVPSMPLRVVGNRFECDARRGIICQGRLANPVDVVDNSFSDPVVGVAWLYLPTPPGQPQIKLPDPTPMIRFSRNRKPDGASMLVNTGDSEWKNRIN